jgi:hypothetical protein
VTRCVSRPQSLFASFFLTLLQDDDISESHIHGFPAPVVEAMVRYFYYHTLDLSSPPLPVDRLIFSLQLGLASMMHGVRPLAKLTDGFAFEPLKDADVYIAALRQTCDMASVDSLEEGFNSAIRMMVQMSIVRHLPAFMIRESFRSLLEERSDILSQLLPFILLPKDLSAAGVTDDQEEPVHLPVTRAGNQLTEMLQNFGV